ncbi:MAG: LD-carboxypeptidase [Pseudomonadota bacterium]|nr:LD-carboxypeptidase [Pseudomonadota bacterium]
MTSLHLYSPSGIVAAAPLRRAARRLTALGYDVEIDASALAKHQRFAGDDDTRLAALHRVAALAPDIAMATRGGYGLTRLLDRIDWALIHRSIERGTRWVGHSDFTALQLGLLAHRHGAGQGAGTCSGHGHAHDATHHHADHGAVGLTWAGPLACGDFGGEGVDDITEPCFVEAMSGELEAVGFRTEPGFDGLAARGMLWGGNLCMVTSLLGTKHWPKASVTRGGVLFLEDVNEHPYRIERSLLQLQQAGVLDAQKAVLLGAFSDFRRSPLDHGYNLKTVVAHLRSLTRTPILTGLPFGHVPTKVTMPVGAKVELLVQGRDVLVGW